VKYGVMFVFPSLVVLVCGRYQHRGITRDGTVDLYPELDHGH